MTVNSILAHDAHYGIGKNGDLPWPRNKDDLKWFKDNTDGHVVVMGRKTWESIGNKKLPNRINIVVTRSELKGSPDGTYFGDMCTLIEMLKKEYPDLVTWIIGGADLYKQTLTFCDNIYVTKFQSDYDCDTFVPMDKYLVSYNENIKETKGDLTFSIWSKNGTVS